jgi:hypothetical protein
MDVAILLLALLTNTPLSRESEPEQTVHALAAYVRSVSLRKGLRARPVARALGIKPCGIEAPRAEWNPDKELSNAYRRCASRRQLGRRLDRPRRRGLIF